MQTAEIIAYFLRGNQPSGHGTMRVAAARAYSAANPITVLYSYDEPIAVRFGGIGEPAGALRLIDHDYSPTTNRQVAAVSFAAKVGFTIKRYNGESWEDRRISCPIHEIEPISRDEIRQLAGLPDTPPRIERRGHHSIDTQDGCRVRMGTRIDR
jgi:hypothetical protein